MPVNKSYKHEHVYQSFTEDQARTRKDITNAQMQRCNVGAAIINDDDMEDGVSDGLTTTNGLSRTELDSHANMPVVGKKCYVLTDTGKTADVSPYTPDYDAMKVSIVDAAIQYDCKFTGQSYALVIRISLYIPAWQNWNNPSDFRRKHSVGQLR